MTKLLTTKQVRAIMREFGAETSDMWTNKNQCVAAHVRTVKCYYYGNEELLRRLQKEAGAENVKLTKGFPIRTATLGQPGPGIVVKCVLA